MNLHRIACVFAALFLIANLGLAQEKKVANVKKSKLGNTKNVHQAGDLFFSGQFSLEDLDDISRADIQRVITLRTDGEIDWDEESAIKAKGMKHLKVPFGSPDMLTDKVFDRIRELLRNQSETTLLHCGSANRVGGVWLPYRVLDEGVDLKTALKEAKQIGLKTPFIQQKALDYIKREQANDSGREKSVKPGINNSFKNPDLDVDAMVQRFELESREVYLLRDTIVENCEIGSGKVVADVGSGTGLFTRLFSKQVGEKGWVFAIDIAPRLVHHVVQQAIEKNLENITGVVCAENSICLPANSVDLVFICDTYHHFEFPRSTLASIRKALRPGGRLVLIDFERIEGKTRAWLMGHVRAGKEVFRAEIQDAGFDLVEEKTIAGFKENYFLVFRKPGNFSSNADS